MPLLRIVHIYACMPPPLRSQNPPHARPRVVSVDLFTPAHPHPSTCQPPCPLKSTESDDTSGALLGDQQQTAGLSRSLRLLQVQAAGGVQLSDLEASHGALGEALGRRRLQHDGEDHGDDDGAGEMVIM